MGRLKIVNKGSREICVAIGRSTEVQRLRGQGIVLFQPVLNAGSALHVSTARGTALDLIAHAESMTALRTGLLVKTVDVLGDQPADDPGGFECH